MDRDRGRGLGCSILFLIFFLLNGFGSGAWLGMFFMFKNCVSGEREISLFDLFFLVFLCYFLF